MNLTTLGLMNFKSFLGEHVVHLPEGGPGRTVYLFGGMNGAGKTSLAQATVLALHGERSAGIPGLFDPGRGVRERYHRWLSAAFNQGARASGEDQMRTWIQLDDGSSHITVSRTWWFDAAGHFLEEQLEVREDAGRESLLSVDADAQTIIDELMPRNLLDFAIFDGERVRRLDDTLSATAVRGALDRLLNLDAVERMRSDVERLARVRRTARADTGQMNAYEALCRQRERKAAEHDELVGRLKQAEDDQDRMQRELDQLASRFDAALSTASSSGQLTTDLMSLRERRNGLRSRLGRHLGEWLFLWPAFSVLPELASEVLEQIEQRTGRDRLKLELQAVDDLAERVGHEQGLRVDVGPDAVQAFRNWLQDAVAERQATLDTATVKVERDPLGQFADAELAEINAAIHGAQRDLTDVRELAEDLLRVDRRLREVEDLLAAADRDSASAQLLRRRDELNVLLGESRATTERLRAEIEVSQSSLASLRQSLASIEARLDVSEDDERWLLLADSTVSALSDFLAQARAEASRAVRDRMLVNVKALLRKQALIADVEIDPDTHVTRLLDAEGNEVGLPSAGEHQLAAMAFTDAVLSASESPLPVFVDTPLARLDSHHRRSVVRDFWPHLGRQVIVLSTDEEVVGDLLSFAMPSLAATFRIDSDANGRSSISPDTYLEVAAS